VGSREAERGRARGEELSTSEFRVAGGSNLEAVGGADIVVLSVPYSAHAQTLQELKDALAGKILVDITVPLNPPRVRTVHLPAGRAAALEAQALLGEQTRVVAALHHVGAAHLTDPAQIIDCDGLVCGDDPEARKSVVRLVEDLGVRAFHAGPLENAIALEALTPVLLFMNKHYKSIGAGVRFTGLQ
jgi:NADPH-dependent F420 reductase